MRPQKILARVAELEPGQHGVSLDQRQARARRVAVEARTAVGGEAEKTPEAKALIGDGVGDLVRQRRALRPERQEAGDQQRAGRRVVAGGGWRRERIGLRGEVAGAVTRRDEPDQPRRFRISPSVRVAALSIPSPTASAVARRVSSRPSARAGSAPWKGRWRAALTAATSLSTSGRNDASVRGAAARASVKAATSLVPPATGRSLR